MTWPWATYQRAVKRFELHIFFSFVDILPKAVRHVAPSNAPLPCRSELLYVPTAHLVMGIEGEEVLLQKAIGEHGSGGWLPDTLDELGICLEVHVLQRVASLEPIVSQGDCHLEHLHLLLFRLLVLRPRGLRILQSFVFLGRWVLRTWSVMTMLCSTFMYALGGHRSRLFI